MLYLFGDLGSATGNPGQPTDGLVIRPGLVLPERDLEYRTSRSSGPGGQHVNKVETRVTIRFDLEATDSLSETQKERVRQRLATRVTRAGVLWVVAQKHRSQSANRDEARARLARLLAAALEPRRRRRATRPSGAAKRRRLEQKRRRGELKRQRRPPRGDQA
jgi:ribosome-associated protein